MQTLLSLLIVLFCLSSAPAKADCYYDAAVFHQVNPWILRGIAYLESSFREDVIHENSDGSTDYGFTQTNSVHLPELAKQGIGKSDLLDACTSVYVAAWLLRKRIDQYGNTCRAIGSYKSKTPAIRDDYTKRLRAVLAQWGQNLEC